MQLCRAACVSETTFDGTLISDTSFEMMRFEDLLTKRISTDSYSETKGYWVVAWRSISDESALHAYAALAGPTIQLCGGHVLTGSASRVQANEAGIQQRTILVEFDSYDRALAAYGSDAYQASLKALGSTAERDLRIVEGT
jgi:uncharacterized protein (DUF1330 family)